VVVVVVICVLRSNDAYVAYHSHHVNTFLHLDARLLMCYVLTMETEHDIPLPPSGRDIYKFSEMAVGDSKFEPDLEKGLRLVTAIRSYARYHRAEGWSITTRRVGTGWRVWRVA
jgi:hypothetical protein